MADSETHEPHYWIIVASRDHVQAGVRDGFAQANHGKSSPLKRLHAGDGIVYYSSKETYGEEAKCQKFTAIGTVKDDDVYVGEMGNDFHPARRNIDFQKSEDVSILPLIEKLTFIQDKKHWGVPFRFGFLQIPREDFELIAAQMLPNL